MFSFNSYDLPEKIFCVLMLGFFLLVGFWLYDVFTVSEAERQAGEAKTQAMRLVCHKNGYTTEEEITSCVTVFDTLFPGKETTRVMPMPMPIPIITRIR